MLSSINWIKVSKVNTFSIIFIILCMIKMGRSHNLEALKLAYVSQGICTPDDQREILEAVSLCQPRGTLIDLKNHMPNNSNIIQVIPEYASVNRCGGSCEMFSHSCIVNETRTRRLQVMTVLSDLPRVQTLTKCGFIEVEEHMSCACGCTVQPQQCRGDQYYERSGCRCLCRDQDARSDCMMNNMQWDPVNCICMCAASSWQVCSTGYVFDFVQTCQCVPTSTTASVGLFAASLVLFTGIILTIITLIVMFRRKIGIFRQMRSRCTTGTLTPQTQYDLVKN